MKEVEISLSPADSADAECILKTAQARINDNRYTHYRIQRRSIDARHGTVRFLLKLHLYLSDEDIPPSFSPKEFKKVNKDGSVVIIGAGPAGLFAALECIQLGIKPIILERGKNVRDRRRDLAAIHKEHIVNPDSNYCFGEGGAGTYSDGKLYTRSTKRGDVRSVLETLVQFGASQDILIDAHPHIGTNRLPQLIAAIRDNIIQCGGEVHFNTRVTDINLEGSRIRSVKTATGEEYSGDAYVLATGHSARDIFYLLGSKGVAIEFKPFALGVRAEHPQSTIDKIQYHCNVRPDQLPAASYSLVHQVGGRGVYSFCMCPGGIIAPCATGVEEVVTNGWSPSKRNNPWANSGIVVPVQWDDLGDYRKYGALAGLEFQKSVEYDAWIAGGKTQVVPAQRLADFTQKIKSAELPSCSYQPGLNSIRMDKLLPEFIAHALREGFMAFGKKMKGYLTNDALIVAPESRTSSPVRIPRNPESLAHTEIENLYPCGEGAGYAGGIISAAMDGERSARAAVLAIKKLF